VRDTTFILLLSGGLIHRNKTVHQSAAFWLQQYCKSIFIL